MIDPNRTHKIYTHTTDQTFYAMINEAKKESLFVDEKGRVDIGELLNLMVVAFGEGRMAIVSDKPVPVIQAQPENIQKINILKGANSILTEEKKPRKKPAKKPEAEEPVQE